MRLIYPMRALVLSVLAVAANVSAQTVVRADAIQTQPTINRDDNGFSACGVRAVATVIVGPKVEMYDFSVNVFREGFTGVMKAGKYRVSLRSTNPMADVKVVQPAPVGFWIARADQAVAVKPIKIIPAMDKGFIMGPSPVVETVRSVVDIADGKEVQFAVRYKDERIDRIVSFAKPLSDLDRSALQACLEALGSAAEASIQ